MQSNNTFDILLLLARPGAGKSEIIRYLKETPLEKRVDRFHVRQFEEIDDFPMLWTWFEEDDILEQMGQPRLHSNTAGYFKGEHLWNVLIRRIDLEYRKKLRVMNYHEEYTTLVEFSRGLQHGGYKEAFKHLSTAFAHHAAILYVDVPWEESLRKNRSRFNPNLPDSILEHAMADEKLEKLYRETDWFELTASDPAHTLIAEVRVPYVVFDNSTDLTTSAGPALGEALEDCLERLWQLYAPH